ncbi:MAG: hypothetical protein ACQEVA_22690 [Myxococcota bacterium]
MENEDTRRIPSSPIFWGAVALLVVAAVVHLSYYLPRTVDDLFISLRYAERFVEGLGLTYNDGAPVEGYSNPTWVLAQAAFIALGIEGVLATKILGVLSLGGLIAALYLGARRLFDAPRGIALLAPALIAANAYIISWSTWGLETPLYLAMLAGLPLVLERCMRHGDLRTSALTAGYVVLFAFTRPEAGLYVLTVGLAIWLRGAGDSAGVDELRDRLRAFLPAAGLSVIGVVSLFVARKLYYGLWLPHTYYAKQGSGFDLDKLATVFSQGAGAFEVAFLVGGLALMVGRAAWKRRFVLLAMSASCLFFVAKVEVDWMPNQRHLLPLYLACALAWTWLATLAWQRREQRALAGAIAAVVAVVVVGAALHTASLDVRFAPTDFRTHGGNTNWVRPKKSKVWDEALMSLRGEIPRHAYDKFEHHPGMVGQLFFLLESSATPEEETWYVGRDIGRVGYYSPVQVFDTPGLFTPEAIYDGEKVPMAAKRTAFDRDVAAAELLGGWYPPPPDVRKHFEMHGRRMRPKNAERPSREQLLARYARIADAFPASFVLATLYGESVGGIVALKNRRVQQLLDKPVLLDALPDGVDGPRATLLGGAMELLGCEVREPVATPDRPAFVDCYWKKNRHVNRDLRAFAHVERIDGPGRVLADHDFAAGMYTTKDAPVGRIIRDSFAVDVRPNTPAGRYRIWMGLWDRRGNASVQTQSLTDEDGRIEGPVVDVSTSK